MPKKTNLLLDIIFYIVLPYLIWNKGKIWLGDYYAILFSTAPSLLYAFYRFIKEKQFNFTGIFLVVSLVSKSIVDVLSSGAEKLLFNEAYLMFFLAFLLFVTVLIKKPLGLYFFADISQAIGLERNEVLQMGKEKKMFQMLNMLTILYVVRYIATGIIKIGLLRMYGVDGYGKMIIVMQAENWIFTILITIYAFKILQKLQGSR